MPIGQYIHVRQAAVAAAAAAAEAAEEVKVCLLAWTFVEKSLRRAAAAVPTSSSPCCGAAAAAAAAGLALLALVKQAQLVPLLRLPALARTLLAGKPPEGLVCWFISYLCPRNLHALL